MFSWCCGMFMTGSTWFPNYILILFSLTLSCVYVKRFRDIKYIFRILIQSHIIYKIYFTEQFYIKLPLANAIQSMDVLTILILIPNNVFGCLKRLVKYVKLYALNLDLVILKCIVIPTLQTHIPKEVIWYQWIIRL